MKKQHTWLVIPAAMLVLALTGCGSTKIDLMEYAAVSFDGINGQGTATCHVDTVSLEQDLAGNDDGEISADELEELGWITQFERTLSCQMDKETGLSNGDTVTVSVSPEHRVLVVRGYSGAEYRPILGFLNVGDFHGAEPWLYQECLRRNIQARVRAYHNKR